VLRSQILEYCKYRAPVVIGYGFLEKLNIFKTLPKQQEALKKKADYEKKLESIEDLCKKIYEDSKQYEDHLSVEDQYCPISPSDIMDKVLKPCNEKFPNITQCTAAHYVISDLQCEEKWNKRSNTTGGGTLEHSKEVLGTGSGDMKWEMSNLQSSYTLLENHTGVSVWTLFGTAVQYHREYLAKVSFFQNVPAQYDVAKDVFERREASLERQIANADEDEDTSGLEDELDELRDEWRKKDEWYHNDFPKVGEKYSWNTVQRNYLNALQNYVDTTWKELKKQLDDTHTWAKTLYEYADTAISDLEQLKTEAKDLKSKGDLWGASVSVDKLGSSDVQSSMHLDYENKAEVINDKHIDETIKILARGKRYAGDIMAELESMEYLSVKLVEEATSGTDWVTSVSLDITLCGRGEQAKALTTNSELAAFKDLLHGEGEYYEPADETTLNQIYNVQEEALSVSGFTDVKDWIDYIRLDPDVVGEKDVVYDFVERSVKAGTVDEQAKAAEKKKRDALRKSATESELDPLPNTPIEDVMGDSGGRSDSPSTAVSNEDEAGTVVDSAVSATGSALESFDLKRLELILTSGRDKLYLMTYASNMFTCYTTKSGETLTNVPYNKTNNALYRAEQEYILWGDSSAEKNVKSTRDTIFGIRLLLNIIYAYTSDPQLKTETLTMATTIAGWTGFGVPIVQNALLIIAALSESVWDTNRLMNGESVPLYKTVNTWAFRYSALNIERAISDALEMGSTKLYEEMNKITSTASKTFNKELDNYINNTIETVVNTAINAVQAPIMEVILWAASHMENEKDKLEEELKTKINDCFTEMEKTFQREVDNADGNGAIMAQIKLYALSLYNTSGNKEALVAMMMKASKIDNGISQTKALSDEVEAWFNTRRQEYIREINAELEKTGVTQALKDDVDAILQDANTNAQEAINEKLNDFMNKMGSSSTSISGSGSDELFADFDSVSASTFSMTYQEYVMVFLAVRFAVAEEKAIGCMGNLIEKNATKSDSAYYAGEGFHLKKANTMLQIEGEASIKPTFIKLPDMTADLSGAGVERYSIRYKGVLGY